MSNPVEPVPASEDAPAFGRPLPNGAIPSLDDNSQGLYVDVSTPNVARIYDYLLGGGNNYFADREAAAELVRLVPGARMACYHNRQFLQRAVRFLVSEAGIRQFIDIGTGLPTQGNVHEMAQSFQPDARVLYVDNDPVVVAHAQELLVNNPTAVAINRDLRCPEHILTHPALHALINFDEPVAILLVAVMHFIRDEDDPSGIVAKLKTAMAPGSYLVLSHVTADELPAGASQKVQRLYDRTTAPGVARGRADIERFFDGLEMVEPGLIDVCGWRTQWTPSEPGQTIFYGGVGRKRAALCMRSGPMAIWLWATARSDSGRSQVLCLL
jgi:S-adenosyl methyltransferase